MAAEGASPRGQRSFLSPRLGAALTGIGPALDRSRRASAKSVPSGSRSARFEQVLDESSGGYSTGYSHAFSFPNPGAEPLLIEVEWTFIVLDDAAPGVWFAEANLTGGRGRSRMAFPAEPGNGRQGAEPTMTISLAGVSEAGVTGSGLVLSGLQNPSSAFAQWTFTAWRLA